jgi:hypothetical protein
MKKFNITFTENKKYHPTTRTVLVEANDELHARNVFASEFDSFTYNKKLMMQVPSGKKVTISKIVEIKEDKKK